jgi:hypothetical protein
MLHILHRERVENIPRRNKETRRLKLCLLFYCTSVFVAKNCRRLRNQKESRLPAGAGRLLVQAHKSARGINNGRLEDALDFAHGALDVQRLDVLPVLLEERNEEVDGQVDVGEQLCLGHLHVADGDTEAEGLLELELHGALDFVEFLKDIFVGAEEGGELAGLRLGGERSVSVSKKQKQTQVKFCKRKLKTKT